MLLPRRLADDRPQLPQPGGVHRPGQHIANPLRQVVRLVDEQRHVACCVENPPDVHRRVKRVVVVADDHVRDFAQRHGEFKRAQAVFVRHRPHVLRRPVVDVHHFLDGFRVAQEVPLRPLAVVRVAQRVCRALLVLRVNHQRPKVQRLLMQACQRVERPLSLRRARGEVVNLPRQPLAKCFERRRERRGGFARARGHTGEEPLFPLDSGVHLHRHLPLTRSVIGIWEFQRGERRIPRPRVPPNRPNPPQIRQEHRLEFRPTFFRRQPLRKFPLHLPAPRHIHHAHVHRRKPARFAEHMPIADRLHPMCGNRRFRRMLPLPELDFLHARDVGGVTEGVHPPAEDERQFLVLHQNRQIQGNFRLPAVAQQLLPRLMTQRAVQHVLHPPGDKADIRAVQGKFDKFPNRDAKFLHGALLSDKKRQTAASPSAARTVLFSPFALFPHSEHCPRRDFAPAGASRGQ